jgi:class 3 adenylate cyclase/pimeloyl-ACP methyl ester carboxylesterase
MKRPETKYVDVGGTDVAYMVIGDGPIDLLYCYGLGSHLENFWDYEPTRNILLRLASFSRLIFFDRRGTGASDGVAGNAIPTWEEWTEDLRAVLDAVASERAAVLASLDASPIAMLYAAMHPDRVSALILVNSGARFAVADDYPIGMPEADINALVAVIREAWGTEDFALASNPSCAQDPDFREFISRIMRALATPRTAAEQYSNILRNDVRDALPLIQAPTLVVHSRDNAFLSSDISRYVADHIPRATFLEWPTGDVALAPFMLGVADHIEEFLTGIRPAVPVERVLTTVLFTDIVASTERAAALGDRAWRELLDKHDRVVREELRHFRGREVNTTGDGFIASFDGPARAIRCARAISDSTRALGVDVRAGLHTGECEVRGDDLGGLAVHIAARVAALAQPGEVTVSSTVKDLVVGSELEFADRGEHELKGVPGAWRLFAVAN